MGTHDTIIVAGTFDVLHDGHYSLLHTAFSRARRVHIHITDDALTAAKAARAGQRIKSFAERASQMAAWCEAQSTDAVNTWWASHADHPAMLSMRGDVREVPYAGRFDIFELADGEGPTTRDATCTGLVCSAETLPACEAINATRAGKGFSPLELVCLPLALDARTGNKLSSTALRAAAAAAGGGV